MRWANNTVTTSGVSDRCRGSSWPSWAGQPPPFTLGVFDVVRPGGRRCGPPGGSRGDAAASAGRARDYAELVAPDEADRPGSGSDGWAFDEGSSALRSPSSTGCSVGSPPRSTTRDPGSASCTDSPGTRSTTTYLGTSTGLRRRWVQPTGTLEVNAKSADLARSSWAGIWTADFGRCGRLRAMADSLTQRLGCGTDVGSICPPAGTTRYCRRRPWRTSWCRSPGLPVRRAAHEGRSVFAAPGGTKIGERLTASRCRSMPIRPSRHGMHPVPDRRPFLGGFLRLRQRGADRPDLLAPRRRHLTVDPDQGIGAPSTSEDFTPAVDNLVLPAATRRGPPPTWSPDVDRGLLLTSQWYLREVDPMTLLLTGLTRDGVFLSRTARSSER